MITKKDLNEIVCLLDKHNLWSKIYHIEPRLEHHDIPEADISKDILAKQYIELNGSDSINVLNSTIVQKEMIPGDKQQNPWPWIHFNHALYHKIYKIKFSTNKLNNVTNGLIPNHPDVGKQIKNIKTGKVYIIRGAYRHWYYGYYLMFLVEQAGSHAQLWWEIISIDPNAKSPDGDNVLAWLTKSISDTRTIHKIINDKK